MLLINTKLAKLANSEKRRFSLSWVTKKSIKVSWNRWKEWNGTFRIFSSISRVLETCERKFELTKNVCETPQTIGIDILIKILHVRRYEMSTKQKKHAKLLMWHTQNWNFILFQFYNFPILNIQNTFNQKRLIQSSTEKSSFAYFVENLYISIVYRTETSSLL